MSREFNLTINFTTNENESFVTIKIEGELNASSALIFEDEIKKIFLTKPQNVYLDLKDVDSIISSAIGSLLVYQDFVIKKGFTFKIISINERIKSILDLK